MIFLIVIYIGLSNFTLHATSELPIPKNFNHGGEQIVANLTLEEKIGQLIMMAVPINDDDPALPAKLLKWHWHPNSSTAYACQLIEKYHIGSVLFIMDGTIATQVAVTNYLNKHNPSSLPILFAADFEPGLNFSRIKDAIPLPRAAEWGAALRQTPVDVSTIQQNPQRAHPEYYRRIKRDKGYELLHELGRTIGRQAYAMGVQVVFAPVVDINSNPENPVINSRAFGTTPKQVIECAIPFMQGIEREGVLSVIKHAPGHGNTKIDSHKELPIIENTRAQLDKLELVPFKTLIKLGVPAVMTGHLLVPAIDDQLPCSLSSKMVQGLLHNEFGFKGLVFCDALNMKALNDYGDSGELAVLAFKAGTHQLVGPYDVPAAFNALREAVYQGVIGEDELDERVVKIIRFKLLQQKPTVLDAEHVKKEITGPRMYAGLTRLREMQQKFLAGDYPQDSVIGNKKKRPD